MVQKKKNPADDAAVDNETKNKEAKEVTEPVSDTEPLGEKVVVSDENFDENTNEVLPERTAPIVKSVEGWKPKTRVGKQVISGEVLSFDEVVSSGEKVLEAEIVDSLLPNLESELLLIGQSKGKFGGGKRKVFRQTQKKTKEGNKLKFSVLTVVGDRNGHVGLGRGKAKETVPAREKSLRKAKLNMISVTRGCGSWECGCGTPHSVPYKISGKSGSVIVTLLPAPKGKGIVGEQDLAKMVALSGIKDVWIKTSGSNTRMNMIFACFDALRNLSSIKVKQGFKHESGFVEGAIGQDKALVSDEAINA